MTDPRNQHTPATDQPPPPSSAPPGGITDAQRRAIQQAAVLRRPINLAAGVAMFGGICTACLAAAALVSMVVLPFDWRMIYVVAVLIIVAVFEFRGRAMLRRIDPRGPAVLAFNQLFFLAAILLYCGWGALKAWLNPIEFDELINQLDELDLGPEIEDMIYHMSDLLMEWLPYAIPGFYGLVALLSVLYLGLVALYYFTRRRAVRRYLDETPAWVRGM